MTIKPSCIQVNNDNLLKWCTKVKDEILQDKDLENFINSIVKSL
ncbi:hypothetical protein [Ureaplasma ceti]